jgi:hypothetical protein
VDTHVGILNKTSGVEFHNIALHSTKNPIERPDPLSVPRVPRMDVNLDHSNKMSVALFFEILEYPVRIVRGALLYLIHVWSWFRLLQAVVIQLVF